MLRYRGHLDGLRTLAVYLVVAFHSGLTSFRDGYIGVDVFFVLSGYLVTRLIVAELSTGTFRLANFYSRRVRRLLPGALLVLIAVTVTWIIIAGPIERASLSDDIGWSVLYSANWHFAAVSTDYFALGDAPSPLLHFWSLAVEEQFYVVWPVLMLAAWALARRLRWSPRWTVASVATVLGIASVVTLRVTAQEGVAGYSYFGTHTRAYQLLAGALLGIWMSRDTAPGGDDYPLPRKTFSVIASRFAAVAGIAGLFALGTNVVDLTTANRSQLIVVVSVALLWGIETDERGPVARVLATPPLRALGLISYGTYLWHFPIIVAIQREYHPSAALMFLIAAGGASLAAALSYVLVERPVRRTPRLVPRPRLVVSTGVLASLIAGLLVMPVVLQTSNHPTLQTAGAAQLPTAGTAEVTGTGTGTQIPPTIPLKGFDLKKASALSHSSPAYGPPPSDPSCSKGKLDACILEHGTGLKVLLMGDSHARMLVPTFRAIAKREHFTLAMAVGTGCPWQRALVFVNSNQKSCETERAHWYKNVVPEFKPDIIILATRATDHKNGSAFKVRSVFSSVKGKNQSEVMANATKQSLTALSAPGRKLIVVEPVPVAPQKAALCLSESTVAAQCNFAADNFPSPAEKAYRSFAATMPGAATINLDPVICPRLPICDPIIGGFLVRQDFDHLTAGFAGSIVSAVQRLYDQALRAAAS